MKRFTLALILLMAAAGCNASTGSRHDADVFKDGVIGTVTTPPIS